MAAAGFHDQPIVLVAIGGDGRAAPPDLPARPAGSLVVAADAGLHVLDHHGVVPDLVVGDLDSVDPEALARAERAGARVVRSEADKDATDLELALELGVGRALGHGIGHLVVVGPGGGRLDHLLGDLLLLSGDHLAPVEVTAHLGAATVTVVRGPGRRTVAGTSGDQVSLVAVAGPARGVTTAGLRWPLVGADLAVASGRARSNELLGPAAEVAVDDGVVLVVQPGTRAPEVAPRTQPYDPSPRLADGNRG